MATRKGIFRDIKLTGNDDIFSIPNDFQYTKKPENSLPYSHKPEEKNMLRSTVDIEINRLIGERET